MIVPTADSNGEEMMPEKITAAALRTPAGLVVTLPQPARHHHIIGAMGAAGFTPMAIANSQQGFITNEARFVGRHEAFVIADIAGQIANGTSIPHTLFSEDLW